MVLMDGKRYRKGNTTMSCLDKTDVGATSDALTRTLCTRMPRNKGGIRCASAQPPPPEAYDRGACSGGGSGATEVRSAGTTGGSSLKAKAGCPHCTAEHPGSSCRRQHAKAPVCGHAPKPTQVSIIPSHICGFACPEDCACPEELPQWVAPICGLLRISLLFLPHTRPWISNAGLGLRPVTSIPVQVL